MDIGVSKLLIPKPKTLHLCPLSTTHEAADISFALVPALQASRTSESLLGGGVFAVVWAQGSR